LGSKGQHATSRPPKPLDDGSVITEICLQIYNTKLHVSFEDETASKFRNVGTKAQMPGDYPHPKKNIQYGIQHTGESLKSRLTCIQLHLLDVFYLWLINNELQIYGIRNTSSTTVVPLCQKVHLCVEIVQQMNSGNSRDVT
jgi:hypothetical protein